MRPKSVYCEECVEDIPNDEIYWDEDRLYCGRCGSELELQRDDVFEQFMSGRPRIVRDEDDEVELLDDEDEEDDLPDDEDEGDEEEKEA